MVSLLSRNIAIAEIPLRFQIAKCKIARIAAAIAEKLPENRRKKKQKKCNDITYLGRGIDIAAFPCVFKNASFLGHYDVGEKEALEEE